MQPSATKTEQMPPQEPPPGAYIEPQAGFEIADPRVQHASELLGEGSVKATAEAPGGYEPEPELAYPVTEDAAMEASEIPEAQEIYDPAIAKDRISELHDSSLRVSIVTTGAGLGLQGQLWQPAGTGRTLLSAFTPYNTGAFNRFVGRDWHETGQGYCSTLGAVSLAQRAFFEAQELGSESATDAPLDIAGLGLSAAVSTDRERAGDNKVHAAIRTNNGIETVEVYMDKDLGRETDGTICDLVGTNLILHAAGIPQIPLRTDIGIKSDQLVETDEGLILKPEPLSPSEFDHSQETVMIGIDGSASEPKLNPELHVIIPGSFNPMHYGHDKIAQAVHDITGREPVLEITGSNIEKSPVTMDDLSARAAQMRGRWPVILTTANTHFTDKAEAYGGCSFAVGHDTAERIINPAYYDNNPHAVQEALKQFADKGINFYVMGREGPDGTLRTAADLDIPEEYRNLFVTLPGDFNVSSSAIRTSLSAKAAR